MGFTEGGALKGWGVFRNSPWEFAGLFPTKEEAEEAAAKAGDGFEARFGEQQVGTDNFVWSSSEN